VSECVWCGSTSAAIDHHAEIARRTRGGDSLHVNEPLLPCFVSSSKLGGGQRRTPLICVPTWLSLRRNLINGIPVAEYSVIHRGEAVSLVTIWMSVFISLACWLKIGVRSTPSPADEEKVNQSAYHQRRDDDSGMTGFEHILLDEWKKCGDGNVQCK